MTVCRVVQDMAFESVCELHTVFGFARVYALLVRFKRLVVVRLCAHKTPTTHHPRLCFVFCFSRFHQDEYIVAGEVQEVSKSALMERMAYLDKISH